MIAFSEHIEIATLLSESAADAPALDVLRDVAVRHGLEHAEPEAVDHAALRQRTERADPDRVQRHGLAARAIHIAYIPLDITTLANGSQFSLIKNTPRARCLGTPRNRYTAGASATEDGVMRLR